MKTPVYSFLKKYIEQQPLRMHMPGHKGKAPVPELQGAYAYDLTEISGADSLFEADGILMESECRAAELFGTAETAYSCGGSTLCIQAMMYLMKKENRCVVAARTVHRAFLNACVLLGLDVVWVYPAKEKGILSGDYMAADFENALRSLNGRTACVYVTSPDYLGNMADVAALAEVSHRYDAPLLVDNAHGAHLAFLDEKKHPMQLGADLCCDSAHKLLPCLTGCAYLHTSNQAYVGKLKAAMGIFGSTSPSYLMLLSLDLCNRFLAEDARTSLAYVCKRTQEMKRRLGERILFGNAKGDILHLSIDAAKMGCDGRRIAAELEKMGCYVEYAGREAVVLLLSASEDVASMERLERCLEACAFEREEECCIEPPGFPKIEQVCGMREAALCASTVVRTEDACGRICASVQVPCPPAVPIVVSGERLDERAIETMLYYGIEDIEVVK